MSDSAKRVLGPDDNYIPTGLPGGFFIYNAEGDGEIFFAEQNIIELFGCKTIAEFRELTNNSFRGMVHPDDYIAIENDIQAQTFASNKQHDYVRYRIITKQGEIRYVEDFGHLLHGEDGQKYFYVYIVDVDKDEYYNRDSNSTAEAQIYAMNQDNDRLTGLMNMNAFYHAVQDILDRPKSPDNEKLAIIHFDIAHFKVFNKNFGFRRGDDVLCRMAYKLRAEFPDRNIARFSDDHFVVCASAERAIDHIMHIHDLMTTAIDDARIEVKAGVYNIEPECCEVGLACDHARLACNTIKQRYDTIYAVYDKDFYEQVRLRQHIVSTVDKAIENEYVQVFYQPIIRTATGKICGYEALARWIDPELGAISPAQFIPTLEEYHAIHKLDCFIVKKVCEDMRALIDQGEPIVPVSVNLSQLDFSLCDVFDQVERYRTHYGIDSDMIDIEITESALNENADHLQAEIKHFRDAGYHVWIDDFGSGYSSLNNLMSYDLDVLKLDLEFLRTYDRNPHAAALIKRIVQMSKDMDMQPLQEGVETAEHFEFLKSIECERAQGYYFAKPMAIDDSRKATRLKGLEWE